MRRCEMRCEWWWWWVEKRRKKKERLTFLWGTAGRPDAVEKA
jgi:hypothetical protein